MNNVRDFKGDIWGIVEGITEWLPISSTGHMILLNEIMPLKVSDAFYSMFEVVIQLGSGTGFLKEYRYRQFKNTGRQRRCPWN